MKVEEAVKLMTHDTAEIYGLLGDRGTIEVGKRADINVIDYENLSISAPRWCTTFPLERLASYKKQVATKAI